MNTYSIQGYTYHWSGMGLETKLTIEAKNMKEVFEKFFAQWPWEFAPWGLHIRLITPKHMKKLHSCLLEKPV